MAPPFPIGQKVICICDDTPAVALLDFTDLPRLGGVYTIAEIGWGEAWITGDSSLGIRLAEIPRRAGAGEVWFSLHRFRLLEDQMEHAAMTQPLALSA